MQGISFAVAVSALSLSAGSAMADTAIAELHPTWSGSPGTGIFMAFSGGYVFADGLVYSTRGTYECDCFALPLGSIAGENEETGRSWFASSDGKFYTINGYQITLGRETQTEFIIPSGGTLDIAVQFQSLHGDNTLSFTDPDSVTTSITSQGTVSYSFTNTTSDWAYKWTSMDLVMTGTVPEPSESVLMLAGVLFLGRRLMSRRPWVDADQSKSVATAYS